MEWGQKIVIEINRQTDISVLHLVISPTLRVARFDWDCCRQTKDSYRKTDRHLCLTSGNIPNTEGGQISLGLL